MRDGGATPEDTAADEAAERSWVRFARLRKHRLLTSAAALALLAALPVASPASAEPDEEGHSRYGRFLAPGEARVDLRHLAGVVAELLVRPRLGVLEAVRLARQLPYGVTGRTSRQ
ncbi:hypothetical protein [Streptomyces sp. MN13]